MGVKLLLAQFRWFAPLPRWASQLVQEVGRQIEADPMNTVDLYSLGQLDGMEKGSHPAVPSPDIASVCGSPLNRHQWQVANQFSPLNNVGREGDPWLPPLLPPPPPPKSIPLSQHPYLLYSPHYHSLTTSHLLNSQDFFHYRSHHLLVFCHTTLYVLLLLLH